MILDVGSVAVAAAGLYFGGLAVARGLCLSEYGARSFARGVVSLGLAALLLAMVAIP